MNLSKIALAGALLALASPLTVLAQSTSQNTAAVQSAALATLSQDDRSQVQNILSLLSTGQISAVTAASQIDGVLSDGEAKSVLAVAKKANIDATDAGQFIVDLAHPPTK